MSQISESYVATIKYILIQYSKLSMGPEMQYHVFQHLYVLASEQTSISHVHYRTYDEGKQAIILITCSPKVYRPQRNSEQEK